MGAVVTPEAAIYRWMSSFGIPAYASAAVPHDAEMPYATYDLVIDDWYGYGTSMEADLWFRTDSEAVPNAKVREVSRAIGAGGVTLPCDGGMLWLKKGSPWAQAVTVDGEDEHVKRRRLNIDIDYFIA